MKYNLFKNGLSWFCSNLKENSWYLIGSSVDYFNIDYPILKINDFDIFIDSKTYSPNDISKLDNVEDFDYWGSAKYINDTLKVDVYRSLLNLDNNKIIIDWMFSNHHEDTDNQVFEKLNIKTQSIKTRVSILKQIANNNVKGSIKAKDKLDRYKIKTLI